MKNLLDLWCHPKNVCMSYVSHLVFFIFKLQIIPNHFINFFSSSTEITKEINKMISVSGCNNYYDKVTALKN